MGKLYGLPPGVDFPVQLVAGLRQRLTERPPEDMAKVTVFLNSQRMRRRVTQILTAEGATLLPRLRLVTDLSPEAARLGIPPSAPGLRRRLELTQLVLRLLETQPDLAPRAAVFDLADSLATLMDEMQGEGVTPGQIAALDVSNHSAHWSRSQAFLGILETFFATDDAPDPQARLRRVIDSLPDLWQHSPPAGPLIIAGSTGSRKTTLRLMQVVSSLPDGMIVLPGYDFDQPHAVWEGMSDALTAEDHPQYRYRRLFDALDCGSDAVKAWTQAEAPCPARNQLVSLSLRPAPVTDQWLIEGQDLQELTGATRDLTLIEADSPRDEALAVALLLREAAEQGKTAALITPDRGLTRQVEAALDRWRLIPDDSAGRPLPLSAPGRFLRHISALLGQKLTAEALITLLKHPLTASGGQRGLHLLFTRELELSLRRKGPPFPTPESLAYWASTQKHADAPKWADWLGRNLGGLEYAREQNLVRHLEQHLEVSEALAAGPWAAGSGGLWLESAGREARRIIDELQAEAHIAGILALHDYRNLFDSVLQRGEVRDDRGAHPGIVIQGTLEARVNGAELVILAGLNDGIWPKLPAPDPWLNRRMRKDAGLSLPERQIGLSAHDYQMAIGAPRVVLSRARRDAEAETVPSRWLNRLTNLLGGLPTRGGPAALEAMRARGKIWLQMADRIEQPAAPMPLARRPSPRPPVAHRPRELPLTRIATLIRNPYEIYARYILRLYPLTPLHPTPDARLRGSTLHKILETYVRLRQRQDRDGARALLLSVARDVLTEDVPWPAARILWLARLAKAADFFLDHDGMLGGTPVSLEEKGKIRLTPLDFTLSGIPDRIDVLPDGRLHIIDYKTGTPPTPAQQASFDKQLLLAACMVERGGFAQLGPAEVAQITYLGLGSSPKMVSTEITPDLTGQTWEALHKLIGRYLEPETGYTSRRAMFETNFAGDYDHLARFGEWEMTEQAAAQDVGVSDA